MPSLETDAAGIAGLNGCGLKVEAALSFEIVGLQAKMQVFAGGHMESSYHSGFCGVRHKAAGAAHATKESAE